MQQGPSVEVEGAVWAGGRARARQDWRRGVGDWWWPGRRKFEFDVASMAGSLPLSSSMANSFALTMTMTTCGATRGCCCCCGRRPVHCTVPTADAGRGRSVWGEGPGCRCDAAGFSLQWRPSFVRTLSFLLRFILGGVLR